MIKFCDIINEAIRNKSFSIERYERKTDTIVKDEFVVGEYVEIYLTKDKSVYGEITNISLSKREVKINGKTWYEFGRIYKTNTQNPKNFVDKSKKDKLSNIIKKINKKHCNIEYSDRVK